MLSVHGSYWPRFLAWLIDDNQWQLKKKKMISDINWFIAIDCYQLQLTVTIIDFIN